ncbi:cadaverine/lysine antiporter, partial [Escherichia coli]
PVLNDPVPAGIACIAIVWVFTFVNMLGGTWVSRLTTIGLVLVLIPVVMTAIVGWHWFDSATYAANWNTADTTDGHAIIKSILLCLWAFVGIESAAVSTGMVKNPKRTVPLATMLGTGLAGIVYIAATQVLSGMYPSSVMAASGAPFAISASTILGNWAAPLVSAFTAFACLTSLGSWMMLVGQAGVRAANDGNFPKVYGEVDSNGIPKKGLLLAAVKMTALMILITLMNSAGGKASDLFGELTGIAVLLTMLPYFYSCVDLIRFEGVNIRNFVSLICSVLGCVFCFIALMGASSFELAGTFIVSLIILMFYARKMHERQSHSMDNHTASNAH